VPEVYIRIAHCHEFNLERPDYDAALEAYNRVIELYEAEVERLDLTANPGGEQQHRGLLKLMALERALFGKARLLESHLAPAAEGQASTDLYAEAAESYRKLTHPRFFGKERFKRSQFVHFRLGVLLAEKLGRVQEGVDVLKAMEKRWAESPWYGRVKWKREQIQRRAAKQAAEGT
jgi:hypothetical protein